jgi:micrococcal nuclease
MKIKFLILISLFLVSCTSSELEGPFKVVRVIDGDTILINTNEKIRLSGIDTPEKEECHFQESKSRLEELILNKEIFLEKDYSNKGRYGRLLRYVHLEDLEINSLMVSEGYAKVNDKYAHDTKKYSQLKKLELKPRKLKKGVWSCKETTISNQ